MGTTRAATSDNGPITAIQMKTTALSVRIKEPHARP